MASPDEGRYVRVCLLVLNVCPLILRKVIEYAYVQQGSLSLQHFLDKNKHALFHLLARTCCCRSRQSKTTPMEKSQWDLLYVQNTAVCQKSHQADCPCQYVAKPGITTNNMDVTLCCLFLFSVCQGINKSHIHTVRDVRNKIIHNGNATLDEQSFYDYWHRVKTALIDLASHVSQALHKETLTIVQQLETQVMNVEDLSMELRRLLVDEKKIKDLEESFREKIDGIEENQDSTTKTLEEMVGKVQQIEDSMSQTRLETERQQTILGKEEAISKLKERLIEINDDTTRIIPISPLQERGEKELPLDLLYASVVICEDPVYTKKRQEIRKGYLSKFMVPAPRVVKKTFDYMKTILKGFAGEKNPSQQEIFPEDIFSIGGKIPRNVYLLGDAARGKTTYSIWILKEWYNAIQNDRKKLNAFEQTMKKFDFVFLLQLRHVNPNTASAIDMICFDLFERQTAYHATIRHVLSSDKYRSLIIMDGLDEWNPNDKTRKRLLHKGIPNLQEMSNTVTCFFSMRPWMLSGISKYISVNDRVIEILGLSEAGMEDVIANVLINHYDLKQDSSNYKDTYERILKYIDENNLKSFMRIPLLAVVCVQIWYEGKHIGDSMTSFYTSMVNMLIERVHLKHDTQLLQVTQATNIPLPNVLSIKKNIKNSIDVLIKLGKVAYDGMLSKQVKIIFQKESLEKEIGARELQFALDIGLISQTEAPSVWTKNVSVHFFHQTIQELLAAIYVVTQRGTNDLLRKHISNVQVILELSNMIMFICGMSPILGSVLSKHIAMITDRDREICLYRDSPLQHSGTVKELYELQVKCYRDIQYEQTDSQVEFHVSDVYLELKSSIETVRVTRELLRDQNCNMKSLFLNTVPVNENIGITNTEVNDFLSNTHNTRSLVMLCIESFEFRCLQQICIPSLRTLHLTGLIMITPCLGIRPSLLMDMDLLSRTLLSMVFGSVGLSLSTRMVNIEKIYLEGVTMTESNWRDFIISLSNLHHEFDVELKNTNIDVESKELIKSSYGFNILRNPTFFRNLLQFRRI